MPHVVSIQVSLPKVMEQKSAGVEDGNQPWTSSFAKQPIQGAVTLHLQHLEGDGQADSKHHGGPDKAVLAYSLGHYGAWRAEFPHLAFSHGGFGENLTVQDLDETNVCIGDIYRIGDSVELEVSQPRIPCWKVSRRWETPRLSERVRDTGRTGWYYRVRQVGRLEAGMQVQLVERPHPELTVALANHLLNKRLDNVHAKQAFANCPMLAQGWRSMLGEGL